MEHARLAVDLFFLLSGFVIARAYEDKLVNGMPLSRFAMIRAIRLLPILWAAVFSAGAIWGFYSVTHHRPLAIGSLLISTGFGLLNLPNITVPATQAFALVKPRWSLFYEAAANLAYAATVRLLSTPVILVLMVASGTALLLTDIEWGLHDPAALPATCRTGFFFLMGVLIYRRHAQGALWRLRIPAPLILIVPIIIFAIPAHLTFEPLASPLIAMGIIPLLVISACQTTLSERASKICGVLGEISYPLYLLQVPMLMLLVPLFDHFKLWLNLYAFAALIPALAVSYCVARFFDEPIREVLSKQFLHRPTRQGLQSAP